MYQDFEGNCVLIVEEDANVTNSMRDYLSRAGFQVRTAMSAWEAFKRVKDGPVDLIISSLDMADADGMSLRDKLTINPATRDIPFFYLVPEGKKDLLVTALRSGVDDCITKPFDPVVLVARIQAVLARRTMYERMARTDPLTHMLNRPTLMEEIGNELQRAARYKHPASLVLLDVDDFSAINAESGFAMGDLLLTCLSGVVMHSIRNVDVAGRYRGECFLLGLPETDAAGAEVVVGRIRETLAKASAPLAGEPLSFCCGIACAPNDGHEMEVLLPRLQHALNHAKEQGKGSVAVWRRDVSDSQDASVDK